MCQKDLGKLKSGNTMTDISSARGMHQALLSKLMQGPSDSEGAMRRAESIFGLGYWQQWNLRHKRRASHSFISHLNQAYLAMLEQSVKRDLLKLEIEIARGNADADAKVLMVEGESLLAKIAKRRTA